MHRGLVSSARWRIVEAMSQFTLLLRQSTADRFFFAKVNKNKIASKFVKLIKIVLIVFISNKLLPYSHSYFRDFVPPFAPSTSCKFWHFVTSRPLCRLGCRSIGGEADRHVGCQSCKTVPVRLVGRRQLLDIYDGSGWQRRSHCVASQKGARHLRPIGNWAK